MTTLLAYMVRFYPGINWKGLDLWTAALLAGEMGEILRLENPKPEK